MKERRNIPVHKSFEAIENVGGALSFNSSGGSVKVLSSDRAIGLSLLTECLRTANFPAEAFAREQQHQLAAIDDAEREPMERGGILFRKLIYGKNPLALPALGTKASVDKLTAADCAALRDRLFVPDNMLLAVAGDFNPDEVVAEIKRLTADWEPGKLPPLDLPKVEKPKDFVEKILTMPEAAQLQFFMGQVGIRRANPDYYKLLVMDYVLGTGTGFTDRLSSRLRDREGLAYTVSANITSSAGIEPGTFSCYIGTEAKNFDRVKKEFLEELNRIRTRAAEAERSRRREEIPARLAAVSIHDERANRGQVAHRRAIPSRLRLSGRLPPRRRSRHARRRARSGPQVHRPRAHDPRSRRRPRRPRQTAGTTSATRRQIGIVSSVVNSSSNPLSVAKPELLAPAGDWEALRAAVAGGADAVYFGLSNFNARHRATNFTADELPQVMDYLAPPQCARLCRAQHADFLRRIGRGRAARGA